MWVRGIQMEKEKIEYRVRRGERRNKVKVGMESE